MVENKALLLHFYTLYVHRCFARWHSGQIDNRIIFHLDANPVFSLSSAAFSAMNDENALSGCRNPPYSLEGPPLLF